jgi:hypothetical protein
MKYVRRIRYLNYRILLIINKFIRFFVESIYKHSKFNLREIGIGF